MQSNALSILLKSSLGKAIGYMNNNWLALARYVTRGNLTLTNNTAEQTMRPIAMYYRYNPMAAWHYGGEPQWRLHM